MSADGFIKARKTKWPCSRRCSRAPRSESRAAISPFETRAAERRKHLNLWPQKNPMGIIHTMPFWDECFPRNGRRIIRDNSHGSNITSTFFRGAFFVRHPELGSMWWWDPNLFGRHLVRSGARASWVPIGNRSLRRTSIRKKKRIFPPWFEPVHGFPPRDIAGKKESPIPSDRSGPAQ